MIMTIWCLVLTAIVVGQGIQINKICKCLDKIKEWKPYVEVMGMRMPRRGQNDTSVKLARQG